LPEQERASFLDRIVKLVVREALGGIAKPAERFAKRVARAVGLILGGIVLAILGVGFVSVGAVKWLSALMPGWLAWLIVGIILFLVGIIVTTTTLASGRS
jgi:lipopolysaccharide export LptBFGC system permease protein LptF